MKNEKHKIDFHLSGPKGRLKSAEDGESSPRGNEGIGGNAASANPTAANENDKPGNEGSPKRRGPRGTAHNEDAGLRRS